MCEEGRGLGEDSDGGKGVLKGAEERPLGMATSPQRLRTGGRKVIFGFLLVPSLPPLPSSPLSFPLPRPWTQCLVNLAEETEIETLTGLRASLLLHRGDPLLPENLCDTEVP